MKKVLHSLEQNTPFNRSGESIRNAKARRNRHSGNWFKEGSSSVKYDTVLFVPATSGSALAKTLRKHEEENLQGRSTRFKVVERSGKSVKQLISKNYPWSVSHCDDPQCFPCSTSQKKPPFSCRIPGAGYRIFCTVCEQRGVPAIYHGETGQNLYTRGGQHISEFGQRLATNGLVIHNQRHHPESSSEFHFRMEGTALFTSPLDRQIDESLRIKYSEAAVIMNSGSEWRSDPIPRARVAKPSRPL